MNETTILEDALKLKKLCDEFMMDQKNTNNKVCEQLQKLARHYWGKS